MNQASNSAKKVPTRRMYFDEAVRQVPKHFAEDGDLILSHLATVLSSVFPDGEDFFVRSVRRFRDQVTDPDLKRQVAGFIGQEAMHGREHRVLNDHLQQLGYPTKRIERMVRQGLAIRERLLTPNSQLAATAALEHFTATLAELVLSSEETRNLFGDETVKGIFLWHALEESEHKAVAFDVYKAMGGGERTRTMTMTVFRYAFVVGITVTVVLSLLTDRETFRRGRLRASWRRVRRAPFMRREVWERLKDYNRSDFHPDDHDTAALVEQWRQSLFGSEGALIDKLVGSAA